MMTAFIPVSLDEAKALDAADPLASWRERFDLPDGEIYLVGHSLGPPSKDSSKNLDRANKHWQSDVVGAWNRADWIRKPMSVGARIAHIIGVREGDVAVCDSVSVNLFKLVGALASRLDGPSRIIVESGEFPTDQYILQRLAELSGHDFLRASPGSGSDYLRQGTILVRSLVDYRTAAVEDVSAVETRVRETGGSVVWDLSHATGVLDLDLRGWGVRYAVGCTYKYLCGGPGAPAFIYVDGDVADGLETPIAGWLGHLRPFAFENDYAPAPGVERFVAGTPPILSMAALEGALGTFDGVDFGLVEAKARHLGDICLHAFANLGLSSESPPVGQRRGGHVSLRHPEGYALSRALSARGIRSDFRTPDTIRFGLSPLFLRYADVWKALRELEDVLETQAYRDPAFQKREAVT